MRFQIPDRFAQILDKALELPVPVGVDWYAQQRRRVNGDNQFHVILGPEKLAPNCLNLKRFPGQAACSSGAQRDNQLGAHEMTFDVIPPLAALNFMTVGAFVQTALAAVFELEMFDRIGDENCLSIQSGFGNSFVQNPASRPDERMTSKILIIPRLFSDHHDRGMRRTFARHHLRRVPE